MIGNFKILLVSASVGGKNAAKKVVSPSKIIPVITVKKHEVRILAQASSLTGISVGSRSLSSSLGAASSLPSTPRPATGLSSSGVSINSSSSSSPAQIYHCYKCGFESSRQNVIMVHTKYCRAVPMNIPSVKGNWVLLGLCEANLLICDSNFSGETCQTDRSHHGENRTRCDVEGVPSDSE